MSIAKARYLIKGFVGSKNGGAPPVPNQWYWQHLWDRRIRSTCTTSTYISTWMMVACTQAGGTGVTSSTGGFEATGKTGQRAQTSHHVWLKLPYHSYCPCLQMEKHTSFTMQRVLAILAVARPVIHCHYAWCTYGASSS